MDSSSTDSIKRQTESTDDNFTIYESEHSEENDSFDQRKPDLNVIKRIFGDIANRLESGADEKVLRVLCRELNDALEMDDFMDIDDFIEIDEVDYYDEPNRFQAGTQDKAYLESPQSTEDYSGKSLDGNNTNYVQNSTNNAGPGSINNTPKATSNIHNGMEFCIESLRSPTNRLVLERYTEPAVMPRTEPKSPTDVPYSKSTKDPNQQRRQLKRYQESVLVPIAESRSPTDVLYSQSPRLPTQQQMPQFRTASSHTFNESDVGSCCAEDSYDVRQVAGFTPMDQHASDVDYFDFRDSSIPSYSRFATEGKPMEAFEGSYDETNSQAQRKISDGGSYPPQDNFYDVRWEIMSNEQPRHAKTVNSYASSCLQKYCQQLRRQKAGRAACNYDSSSPKVNKGRRKSTANIEKSNNPTLPPPRRARSQSFGGYNKEGESPKQCTQLRMSPAEAGYLASCIVNELLENLQPYVPTPDNENSRSSRPNSTNCSNQARRPRSQRTYSRSNSVSMLEDEEMPSLMLNDSCLNSTTNSNAMSSQARRPRSKRNYCRGNTVSRVEEEPMPTFNNSCLNSTASMLENESMPSFINDSYLNNSNNLESSQRVGVRRPNSNMQQCLGYNDFATGVQCEETNNVLNSTRTDDSLAEAIRCDETIEIGDETIEVPNSIQCDNDNTNSSQFTPCPRFKHFMDAYHEFLKYTPDASYDEFYKSYRQQLSDETAGYSEFLRLHGLVTLPAVGVRVPEKDCLRKLKKFGSAKSQ